MRKSVLTTIALLFGNYLLISQDIPGLSYCLLFDSNLEKQAFQKSNNNECDPLIFLLAYDPKIDSSQYIAVKNELSGYANKLREKRKAFRKESKFLHYVFYKVHHEYLKSYKHSESFNGIFNGGSYNCVSGTALYGCLLSQLGYSPKIYETRYHIFLLVDLKDSTRILFETTDPLQGFVDNKEKISKRITHYLKDEQETLTKRLTLSAPFSNQVILEDVSLKEVAGLHYYNLAINFINNENYYDAFRALKKANILYPESQRIKDFLWLTYFKYESELSTAFVNN
jgi:hypothetical protein